MIRSLSMIGSIHLIVSIWSDILLIQKHFTTTMLRTHCTMQTYVSPGLIHMSSVNWILFLFRIWTVTHFTARIPIIQAESVDWFRKYRKRHPKQPSSPQMISSSTKTSIVVFLKIPLFFLWIFIASHYHSWSTSLLQEFLQCLMESFFQIICQKRYRKRL